MSTHWKFERRVIKRDREKSQEDLIFMDEDSNFYGDIYLYLYIN
jgi:hypothetical protein